MLSVGILNDARDGAISQNAYRIIRRCILYPHPYDAPVMHNAPETIDANHHPKHPKQCTKNAPEKVKAARQYMLF